MMTAYPTPSAATLASAPGRNLTTEEAAREIGISRTAVYGLLRKGDLGSVKIGNRRRIPQAEAQRYIRSLCA